MTPTPHLEVLDPTVEPVPAHAGIAPRPETLDGAVVGLLANGKRNAEGLIEMACGILADRYEFNEIVARNKGNATRPCPEGMMEELAEQCDVVITASGD